MCRRKDSCLQEQSRVIIGSGILFVFGSGCCTCSDVGFYCTQIYFVKWRVRFFDCLAFCVRVYLFLVYYMCSNVGLAYVGVFCNMWGQVVVVRTLVCFLYLMGRCVNVVTCIRWSTRYFIIFDCVQDLVLFCNFVIFRLLYVVEVLFSMVRVQQLLQHFEQCSFSAFYLFCCVPQFFCCVPYS